MRIYVASSWRNKHQPNVVNALRKDGHEVYDFRNPWDTGAGFGWGEINANWKQWGTTEYLDALVHPKAERGFKSDFGAMKWAESCVMVMPCGRSAHLEAGYFVGARKPLVIFLPEVAEPELMYKMADFITTSEDELLIALRLSNIKMEASH